MKDSRRTIPIRLGATLIILVVIRILKDSTAPSSQNTVFRVVREAWIGDLPNAYVRAKGVFVYTLIWDGSFQ